MRVKTVTIGFVVSALPVIGLTWASAVQGGQIDIGAQPAVITGQSEQIEPGKFQQHTFSIAGALRIICHGGVSFEGTTQSLSSSEIVLTPTWPVCTISTQIRMNGCKYFLTGSGQPANTYKLDIVGCTAGKQIEMITPFCIFAVPPQNELSHSVLSPNGTEGTLRMTIASMTVVQTGGSCPNGNNFHSAKGEIAGNTTMKAYAHAGTSQVFKHTHEYLEVIEGKQVSLTST